MKILHDVVLCCDNFGQIMMKGFMNKNLNASRPSEHLPVRGKIIKTFRWNHSLLY